MLERNCDPELFADFPTIQRVIEAHPTAPSIALAAIWELKQPEEMGKFMSELSRLFSMTEDEQIASNPQKAATLEVGYWLGNETDRAIHKRWDKAMEGLEHPFFGRLIFL